MQSANHTHFEADARPLVPPHMQRILRALPDDVRASLTPEQVLAISAATSPQSAHHWVNIKSSLPLWRRRMFINLQIGPERRSLQRLRDEKQLSARRTSLIMLVLLYVIITVASLLVLVALYLLKSTLGINIFEAQSPFHDLLYARYLSR